jgi:uncharacterized protein (TIGR03083 family)
VLLTPLYDKAFLRLELPLGDPSEPLLRQRRRLAALLAELDDAEWAAPSRCEAWSVQDVVSHLVTTNQFWAFAVGAARAGAPTRVLATFDPVASPAEMVAAVRSQGPADVLAQFVEGVDALAAAVEGLDADGWAMPGEAPPGHVPLSAVALHALWDSWVHERDILLPLGRPPVDEPDEIIGSLAYAAALSPAFGVGRGSTRRGAVDLAVTDPDVAFVVEVGDDVVVRLGAAPDGALRLRGPAVPVLEALSYRAPLPCAVADEHRWLFSDLAEVFDREP